VKFTPRSGSISVHLSQADDTVRVTVRDSGIGIGPEFLPYVFDRFRQADATINRAHGGLGLGLAITRHLVELQGGHICAISPGHGQGAEFRVDFPARSGSTHPLQNAGEHAEPAVDRSHILVPRLQGIRILAVDDDRDALALMREILEATGATVVTADSGRQALEAIARSTPDVLLADLAMPDVNGFELIERIRRSDRTEVREILAIAVTAYARSEDRTKALSSGFQMQLSKPVDPAHLMGTIAAMVRRHAGNRAGVHLTRGSE
jgi:CheY-like chemotaxis protein